MKIMKIIRIVFEYLSHKSVVMVFPIFSIIGFLIISTPAWAQQQQQGTNWLKECKNPIVDAKIKEPCEELTTPDGYTLTPLGEHVLACLRGNPLTLLTVAQNC
jgi:hypothetical protein